MRWCPGPRTSSPTSSSTDEGAGPGGLRAACLAAALLVGGAAHALSLYDPSTGGLPSSQGWFQLLAGSPGTQSVDGGLYRLDTTVPGADTHGYGRFSPLTLNTAQGFTLDFTLRVAAESHSSSNRAGFSILFVGSSAASSLELAFWGNEVFAYHYDANDPDRFVHGIGATLDTGPLRNYTLSVSNQQFSLSSGSSTLFGGSLENYTAQGAPYTLPNFIFFGDNTSRGASSIELAGLALLPVPELPPAALMLLGLGVLGWKRFSPSGSTAACPHDRLPRR